MWKELKAHVRVGMFKYLLKILKLMWHFVVSLFFVGYEIFSSVNEANTRNSLSSLLAHVNVY